MAKIFGSCPHDVVLDPEKWVAFADYFKQKKILDSDFQRFMSFTEFADNFQRFSFVYAHPLHAVQLAREHGFIPLAKYTDTYDEAVLIASKSIPSPSREKMDEQKVAFVHQTPSHAAFLIDRLRHYPEVEIDPVIKDTYPNVLMAVSIQEALYGVILQSVWEQMISMKDSVNHFYTTKLQELVHVFMVSPDLSEIVVPLRKALLEMHLDTEGKKILNRLKCDSFTAFGTGELEALSKSLSLCDF